MAKPLIIDNGLYTNFVARLARDIEVAYFSVWGNAAPTSRELAPGTGFDNIERVNNPLEFILAGKASAIYIPDVYLSDYDYLARESELPVFSAGRGARLETDRWFLKEFLDRNGLEVIASVEIEGIDALEAYLREPAHRDKYIKVSVMRGDLETFHHEDWDATAGWFTELRAKVGPLGANIGFIIEDPIPDAYEVGVDCLVMDGEILTPFVVGPEIKDAGYAGVICESLDVLPEGVRAVMGALSGYFRETEYRGFFSNEMRVLSDGRVYFTDATCRIPSPPGGVLMAAMRNFAQVVDAIANGKSAEPDFGSAEYLYEIILKSDWASEHFVEARFPKKDAERYSFHNHCQIDGRTWIIPHSWGHSEVASALGWGSDRKEARAMSEAAAEAIKAYPHSFEYQRDALECADNGLDKGAKLGFPT